jgi:hypothetical protein
MADFFKVSTDFLLGKIDYDGSYLLLLFSVKLNEKMKEAHNVATGNTSLWIYVTIA